MPQKQNRQLDGYLRELRNPSKYWNFEQLSKEKQKEKRVRERKREKERG